MVTPCTEVPTLAKRAQTAQARLQPNNLIKNVIYETFVTISLFGSGSRALPNQRSREGRARLQGEDGLSPRKESSKDYRNRGFRFVEPAIFAN